MSVAWFIIVSLLWTSALAGGASLLTNGRINARFAQTVWRGAALLAVLPLLIVPLLSLMPAELPSALPDLPYVEPAAGAVSTASASLQSAVSGPEWNWTAPALLGVLIAGWLGRAVFFLLGQARLQRLKSRSRPIDATIDNLSLTLQGFERVPALRQIEGGSPFVAGILDRAIYVPQGLETPGDLRQIVIHECVHVRRGDLVTRPIERLVADIFWFSPFAWMMRRELDFWREAVCDEIASNLSGDRIGYARTLAYAARLSAPTRALPVAAFILPRKSALPKRLSRLLEGGPTRSRPGVAIAASVFALSLAPFALAEAGKEAPLRIENAGVKDVEFSHAVINSPKARISSRFGKRPDPFSNTIKWHKGTDIAAPKGTPVYTPSCGTVVFSGYKVNYGETIEIAFSDGSHMRFAQLADRDVEVGEEVAVGTQIGTVGMSGRATGPHLHLEHWTITKDKDGISKLKPSDPSKSEGLVLMAGG
ncbi:M23/M56 family metallopeptidase [Henriciella litoralis]|uniref:M23/M56 family metallopeptidase n=1 Tax=Henriciella litoralis TaxID=568102 RepID=UPI0009FD0160|nr:M23/M56 family metallopeptidase [Henriciella litoralis]